MNANTIFGVWCIGFALALLWFFRPLEVKGQRSFVKWRSAWMDKRHRFQLIAQFGMALFWPLTMLATCCFLVVILIAGVIERRAERERQRTYRRQQANAFHLPPHLRDAYRRALHEESKQ